MKDAVAVHRALLEHGVAHEVVRLRRPLHDADELPEVLGVPPAACAVVRCYVAGRRTGAGDGTGDGARGRVHAVVAPAGLEPLPLALRAALGTPDVRPATAAEVNAATDCAARLVSPVGLPDDVGVLLDAGLDLRGTVWTPTGDSGTAVWLAGADLRATTGATVVDLTGTARPAVVDLRGPADVPAPASRGGLVQA